MPGFLVPNWPARMDKEREIGTDAEGTKKRPSLKTARVLQEATDGDLHWPLVNGNRGQGMPSWAMRKSGR